MKPIILSATTIALVVGILALRMQGLMDLFPFALGPLVVTWLLGWQCETRISGVLLLGAALLYSPWFGYTYLSVFHWNPDPAYAGMAMLFVGILSLPMMLPLWIVAFLNRRAKTSAI